MSSDVWKEVEGKIDDLGYPLITYLGRFRFNVRSLANH